MSERVVVIGGGGHAKVVIDIIRLAGDAVVGILDDGLDIGAQVLGYPVIGRITDVEYYAKCLFIIAIGANDVRWRIVETIDVHWYTAIHPSAVVSEFSHIGCGSVIMANAVVNSNSVIGRHCIINTSAVVEHDNKLGDFVHLSPRAVLGGTVTIGDRTSIGIGATVRNNICICEDCIIGAGAVIINNICERGTYVGVPACKISH